MTNHAGRFDGNQPVPALDGPISAVQARRLSRRLGDVGVVVPPARLAEIGAGATASDRELTDVQFALAAIAIRCEEHAARARRRRQAGARWLIVAALTITALNFLACLGYVFFSLLGHA